MIKILKESTFQVKEVISVSVQVLIRKYIPIATLCLILFLITTLSSILSLIDFGHTIFNLSYKILGLAMIIILFFVFHLFLLKYILGIVNKSKLGLFRKHNLPTKKQIFNVILASIMVIIAAILVYLIVAVIVFPLVNLRWISLNGAITLNVVFGGVFFIYLMIKISFFPFFIIEKSESAIESIKMSFALTKGNFLNLILLFGILVIMYVFYTFLYSLGFVLLSMVVNLLTSFVVVPLSSIVLTVAYRNMMDNFTGKIHSDLLENII